MLHRGGKLVLIFVKPDADPCWSAADMCRAATFEARWASMGVSEDERRRLLPCAIWKAKWPETVFHDTVMKRLEELSCSA